MRRAGNVTRPLGLVIFAIACGAGTSIAQIDPAVTAGLTWLNSHQNPNGTWGGIAELSPRDTARVLIAQYLLRASNSSVTTGLSWLSGQQGLSPNEFLAEQAFALSQAGVDNGTVLSRLLGQRSSIGQDFGGFVNHSGNTYDSALAMEAFATKETAYATTLGGIESALLLRQNSDGGWGFDLGFSSHPVFTSEVLIAITSLRFIQPPPAAVSAAQQYLVHLIQADGSVMGGGVFGTALVYRALGLSGYSVSVLPVSPLSFLKSQQLPDGSWGSGDAYLTARALEAFAAKKPNLAISGGTLSLNPTSVSDGATVTAKFTVANVGSVAAPASSASLFVGDTSGRNLGSASLAALAPGASQQITITFTATQLTGPQTLLAVVDPNNQIDELRKDDNRATATLTVTGKPDLQIFSNDIATIPSRLQPNQAAQVTVTIHNNGQGDAANVVYTLTDTLGTVQTLLKRDTIPSIPSGGSQVVSVPVTLSGGSHILVAVADPDNQIPETDETNNRASRTITVNTVSNVDLKLGPGSLTVTPARPAPGDTITVKATVENTGTDPVQSTLVLYDGVPGSGGVAFATVPISIDAVSGIVVQRTYTTTANSKVIYAVADPDNLVPEIDETNNTAFAPLTDQLVDLAIRQDGLVLPRIAPSAHQTITGRVVVRNLGLLAATQAEVVLYDDLPQNGGQVVSDTFVDVSGGSITVVTASWTVRAGQHFATAIVNPTHSIFEPDYSNNRVTRLYSVNGSGPNIYIDTSQRSNPAASIDVSGLTVNPVDLTVSGLLRATVHLAGVTQPFAITLFEDVDGDGAFNPEVDNALGSTLVQPGIDPQVVQIVASGVVRFARGHLLLYLDSGNSVEESDENNFVDIFEDCFTTGKTINPVRKWSTPGLRSNVLSPVARLIDLNGDGVRDDNDVPIVAQMSFGNVFARRGDTGQPVWVHSGGLSGGAMSMAVGDVDGDGQAEIIAHADKHRLVCLSAVDGHVKWTSPELERNPYWDFLEQIGINNFTYVGAPLIADLNGDGHPEVILGRTVLDGATGAINWVGTGGQGRAWYDDAFGTLYAQAFPDQNVSIAVDLDGDGKLEVVAGNTAYRGNGTIYWYRSDLPDGYTAPLFLTGDPVRKICLVANGKIYLLNGTTGASVWGPVAIPGGALLGGAPTIFMNGSNGPYIGVAGDGFYSVLKAVDGTVLWTKQVSAPQAFNTALNSATAFDFGTGMTLVYQSIDTFLILRATDGSVLYQEANQVYPYHPGGAIVADVDGDGRADIIVEGRENGIGMHVIGDPTWNGAPAVYNEATYHVVNVAESGAIPTSEIETSYSRVNYRSNPAVSLPGSAPLPNLTASYVRADTSGYPASIKIMARIGNMGLASVPAGVSVAFYRGDPSSGGILLGVSQTAGALGPSDYEDVAFVWNSPPQGSYTFYVVADRNSAGQGSIAECNEQDNTASVAAAVRLSADVATNNNSIFVSDVSPRPGDTVTLGASAAISGAVPVANLLAQFYLGDPRSGGTPISGLLPVQVATSFGQTTGTVSFAWTVNAPTGPQTIACFFDPQNLIAEDDETNNVALTTIQVSTPDPILKLSGSLTLTPPSAEPGTAISIRALLQNIGNVPLTGTVLNYEVSSGGGPPLFTGSVTIASLAKLAYADLAIGAFTPTSNGTYTVTLSPADSAVTLLVDPKTIKIAPFAGAVLTAVPSRVPVSLPLVQAHLNVSRLNTIVVPDDPLVDIVKASIQKGVNWEQPAVINFGVNAGCFKCHVQSQALTSLEASRNVSGIQVDDATTSKVFNQMLSLQTARGDFERPAWGATTATLGAWSLSYYHDQVAAQPAILKALDFLATRQNADGSFDCDADYRCSISYGNREAMTMMNMITFARGYEKTQNPQYLHVLTAATTWALSYDYRTNGNRGAEFPARIAIGLATALPQITDTSLAAVMQARIQAIIAYLRSLQNPDGSFGTQSSPDFPIVRTAQSLYALALAGVPGSDPQLRSAILWLINHQQANGGWVELRSELSDQETWVDETTWTMIALPAAFLRLGQFDVDSVITLPSSTQLVSSNISASSTRSVTGGTEYTWHFPNVTEAGTDLYFNVRLNGLAVDEVRPVAGISSLKYNDPYSEAAVVRNISVPSVTGFGPLLLTVATDQPAYGPNAPVTITERVTNVGTNIVGITNSLDIRDSNGALVATVAASDSVQGLPPSAFPGWHATVPVAFTVANDGLSRIVIFPLSFSQLLTQAGVAGTFDRNSIRVSSDDAPGTEWYFAYQPSTADPTSGQLVVSVPDGIAAGSPVNLHVFFDTVDNGKAASLFDQSVSGAMAGAGIAATYYLLDKTQTNINTTVPDGVVFQQPPILRTVQSTSAIFSQAPAGVPQEYWGTVWTGVLNVPTTGTYNFLIGSDDGMWFSIDGVIRLSNPGIHGTTEKTTSLALTAGLHPIKVTMFNWCCGYSAYVKWAPPSQGFVVIPQSNLLTALPAAPTSAIMVGTAVALPAGTVTLTYSWNTGSTAAGPYSAVGTLRQNGAFIVSSSAPFSITPFSAFTGTVSTDRVSYNVNETAHVNAAVRYDNGNLIVSGLSAILSIVSPGGTLLATSTINLSAMSPGQTAPATLDWPVGSSLPGIYQANLVLKDSGGATLLTQSSPFTVLSSADTGKGLTGTISAPATVFQGTTMNFSSSITNGGNAAVSNAPFAIRILDFATQSLVATIPITASIGQGTTFTLQSPFSTAGLSAQKYTAYLVSLITGQPQPLASATFDLLPVADLSITLGDSPDPVIEHQNLTYTMTVRNHGPSSATGVIVTNTLPSGVTFGSATPSQGSCSGTPVVSCVIGPLAKDAVATVTIVVTPSSPGTLSDTVSVKGNETDLNPSDNTATASTQVNPAALLNLDIVSAAHARVLLWVNCSPGNSGKGCTPPLPPFLKQTLETAGIRYALVGDEYTFLDQMRTGAYSGAILYQLGSAEAKVATEYLEDIRFGFGLLFIDNSPDNNPKLGPALQISFQGTIHGPTTLDLLSTPFTSPGTLTLNGDGVRLSLAGATAAANVTGTSKPAISYATFGVGHVVVVPFDTELTATPAVATLLVSAINYISFAPASPYQAREVVAETLRVTTQPGGPVPVTLTLTLPSGMSIVDALPAPSSTSPPTWNLEIPGDTQKEFYLWLRLPDAAGTFTITAAAGLQEQLPSVTKDLTLVVTADRSQLESQLLADLNALKTVATKTSDKKAIDDAITLLSAIQAMSNPDAAGVLSIIDKAMQILGDLESLTTNAAVAIADDDRLLIYWQSRTVP